jgi:hypothetical protein
MQNKFAEASPRTFNPMLAPELSDETRKAVKAAFDAMSTWRVEIVNSSEKSGEQVVEKMAAAVWHCWRLAEAPAAGPGSASWAEVHA